MNRSNRSISERWEAWRAIKPSSKEEWSFRQCGKVFEGLMIWNERRLALEKEPCFILHFCKLIRAELVHCGHLGFLVTWMWLNVTCTTSKQAGYILTSCCVKMMSRCCFCHFFPSAPQSVPKQKSSCRSCFGSNSSDKNRTRSRGFFYSWNGTCSIWTWLVAFRWAAKRIKIMGDGWKWKSCESDVKVNLWS